MKNVSAGSTLGAVTIELSPAPSIIAGAVETPDARQARHDQIQKSMEQLFQAAIAHVGETTAKTLWDSVSARKRGRPSGSTNPSGDLELLEIYDWVGERLGFPADLPRRLAEDCHIKVPGKFGASAKAIEKHVRKLLKERSRRAGETALRIEAVFGVSSSMSLLTEAAAKNEPAVRDSDH